MARFQEALKIHLRRREERLDLQLREADNELKVACSLSTSPLLTPFVRRKFVRSANRWVSRCTTCNKNWLDIRCCWRRSTIGSARSTRIGSVSNKTSSKSRRSIRRRERSSTPKCDKVEHGDVQESETHVREILSSLALQTQKDRDVLQRRLHYLNKAKGDIRGRNRRVRLKHGSSMLEFRRSINDASSNGKGRFRSDQIGNREEDAGNFPWHSEA